MRRTTVAWLTFLLVVPATSAADDDWKKGILLYALRDDQGVGADPGQVVLYRKGRGLEVKFESGQTLLEVQDFRVIPYDSKFSASRLFLHLLMAKDFPTRCHYDRGYDPSAFSRINNRLRNRYLLAKNVANEFPKHHLHDELLVLACEFLEEYEEHESRGKTDYRETISQIRKYLKKYPSGRHRHRLEWRKVVLENAVYEFGGHARGPVSQIKAFERFLAQHPRTPIRDEIELELARLYRIAYELITFSETEDQKAGLKDKHARRFLNKARNLYKKLLKSRNLKTRETARVALFNMRHNRTTSSSIVLPNDW